MEKVGVDMARPPDEIERQKLIMREDRRNLVNRQLRKKEDGEFVTWEEANAEARPPTVQEKLIIHAEKHQEKVQPQRPKEALQVMLETTDLEGRPEAVQKIDLLWRTRALKLKWTVRRLKDELAERTGIATDDMELEFHGVVLEDAWDVEDIVNINDEDTVTMRIVGHGSKLSDLKSVQQEAIPVEGSFDAMHQKVEKAVEAQTTTGEGFELEPGWAFTASTSYRALMEHFETERDLIDVQGCQTYISHELKTMQDAHRDMVILEEEHEKLLKHIHVDSTRELRVQTEIERIMEKDAKAMRDEDTERVARILAARENKKVESTELNAAEEAQLHFLYVVDLGLFLFLIISYTLVTFMTRGMSGHMFYTSNALQSFIGDQYKGMDYKMVINEPAFWQYIQPFATAAVIDNGFIARHNRVVGTVQLRQLRVEQRECPLKLFKGDPRFGSCYPAYSEQVQTTESFGSVPGANPGMNRTFTGKFAYQVDLMDGSSCTSIHTGIEYPAGGYIVELPAKPEEIAPALKKLREEWWIDLQTRVVLVEFNTYNANVDLITAVRLIFEFSAAGSVYTSATVMTFRPFRYYTGYDWIVFSIEALILIYMAAFAFLESKRLQMEGFYTYFTDFWHIAEWCNVVGFVISIFLRIIFLIQAGDFQIDIKRAGADDIWALANLYQTECNIAALNSFILYIQIFKYLGHQPGIARIAGVLKASTPDVTAFWAIFVIIQFAFAQFGWLQFGASVETLRTATTSFETSLLIAYGMDTYKTLLVAYPGSGGAFTVLYLFVFIFVMMNIFISIVTYSFEQLSQNEQSFDDLLEWWPFRRAFNQLYWANEALMTGEGTRELKLLHEEIENLIQNDEHVDLEAMDALIYRFPRAADVLHCTHGAFNEEKAAELMTRYDVARTGTLEKVELEAMVANMQKREKEMTRLSSLVSRTTLENQQARLERQAKEKKSNQQKADLASLKPGGLSSTKGQPGTEIELVEINPLAANHV